eukprot:7591576-Alexandrium_andersonii.AAC.1
MSASLVGSEMCIRDSRRPIPRWPGRYKPQSKRRPLTPPPTMPRPLPPRCLLYTSDAADDM